jgi:hypothetical protein
MNLPPPERLREWGRSFYTRLMRLLALSLRYETVGPEADLSEAPFFCQFVGYFIPYDLRKARRLP